MSKYLDLTGLQRYDSKIKQYISDHGGGGADIGIVTITSVATSLTTAQYTEAQKDPAIIIEGSYIYSKTFDGGSGGSLVFIAYLNKQIKTIHISSLRAITRSTYEFPEDNHVVKNITFSLDPNEWTETGYEQWEAEFTKADGTSIRFVFNSETGELDYTLTLGAVNMDTLQAFHLCLEEFPQVSGSMYYDFVYNPHVDGIRTWLNGQQYDDYGGLGFYNYNTVENTSYFEDLISLGTHDFHQSTDDITITFEYNECENCYVQIEV